MEERFRAGDRVRLVSNSFVTRSEHYLPSWIKTEPSFVVVETTTYWGDQYLILESSIRKGVFSKPLNANLFEKEPYIVALAYTRAAGIYEGVITWTQFLNKADFDRWFTEDIRKKQRVVEEGISSERAVELAEQTPLACRIAVELLKK